MKPGRIIEFPPYRGRSINDNKVVYGCLLNQVRQTADGDFEELFIVPPAELKKRNGWAVLIDPESLTRYTGLRDCENTPIYEGDVVQSVNIIAQEVFKFVVEYGECGDRRSLSEGGGYMGFFFHLIDGNNIQKAVQCRTDPLYWLNHTQCRVLHSEDDTWRD